MGVVARYLMPDDFVAKRDNRSGAGTVIVAALFVETNGVYADVEDVEVWDEGRDARIYAGPYPVVAHPPCASWSRLAGFREARWGRKRGEDGGCFEAALDAVREFGGVLEHPAHSRAWDRFGLAEPQWRHGWTMGLDGGATCYVEQSRYGSAVKKATWLYAYGVHLHELRWGYSPDQDGHGPGGIDAWRQTVTWQDASATPPDFRDELLRLARSVTRRST